MYLCTTIWSWVYGDAADDISKMMWSIYKSRKMNDKIFEQKWGKNSWKTLAYSPLKENDVLHNVLK